MNMEKAKKSVVIGASSNPERYAFLATQRLAENGYEVIPVGLRDGQIGEHKIRTERKPIENVDTVTLYVGPRHQESWGEYIISLSPKRVIFNPGTENEDFEKTLQDEGIETERACTLVLPGTNAY
jgi:predicted CoA-binding protein